MGGHRGNKQATKRKQQQVAQSSEQGVQPRGGTSSSSKNDEVSGEESTNDGVIAGDEIIVPHTVGEEGTGEFVQGEEWLEDEGSTIGTSSLVTSTESKFDRETKWGLH
jgi:hypothetical protein